MPPDARLGGAPHLQELRAPEPRLDLLPRHVLQQDRPPTARDRLRRAARGGSGAALVHLGFAAAFYYLLSFRDVERPREVETPVDVVVEPAKPPASGPAGGEKPSGGGGPEAPKPSPEPTAPQAPKGQATERLRQALAPPVAPDPEPPAPAQARPPKPPPPASPAKAPPPAQVSQPSQGEPEAPRLVAPPPEPTRAAADERQTKPANLAPEADRQDAAKRESQPAEVPRVLTTADARAGFAVPLPAAAPPAPAPKPAPPIPAKAPSETEKLAAALPMSTVAMPSTFRSVLAGNGAQVNAAYKGLVFGRFNRHPEIGERARRLHLRGQVIVAFTIDDAGEIREIGVAQSSGNAALDALGLEMIRAAAPFPPPPPEAQHSFTPALAFGE